MHTRPARSLSLRKRNGIQVFSKLPVFIKGSLQDNTFEFEASLSQHLKMKAEQYKGKKAEEMAEQNREKRKSIAILKCQLEQINMSDRSARLEEGRKEYQNMSLAEKKRLSKGFQLHFEANQKLDTLQERLNKLKLDVLRLQQEDRAPNRKS